VATPLKISSGWRGNFLLSAAEQWLKHELTKNFRVIRDLELLPQITGQDWSSVFLQRFDGVVTCVGFRLKYHQHFKKKTFLPGFGQKLDSG
jgi:hypothetical protein